MQIFDRDHNGILDSDELEQVSAWLRHSYIVIVHDIRLDWFAALEFGILLFAALIFLWCTS